MGDRAIIPWYLKRVETKREKIRFEIHSFTGKEEVFSAVAVYGYPFPGNTVSIRSGKAGLIECALGKSMLVHEVSDFFRNDCEEWTGVLYKDLAYLILKARGSVQSFIQQPMESLSQLQVYAITAP